MAKSVHSGRVKERARQPCFNGCVYVEHTHMSHIELNFRVSVKERACQPCFNGDVYVEHT